ncbi:MAG: MAPEG family protein [Acidobacteriota bacterium]
MASLPYFAIAAALVLIYLPRFVVWREMSKLEGGYDNREPRAQQAQLAGLGRRALAAHHNGFEAFAPFAVAVLAAVQRGVKVELVGAIAIGFVVVRLGYVVAYLADRASLRSTLWSLGMTATATLLVLAILG